MSEFTEAACVAMNNSVINRKEQRDRLEIERVSALPLSNTGSKSLIKGDDGQPLPLRGADGTPTIYGLLVWFGLSVPPAATEQVKYKSAVYASWAKNGFKFNLVKPGARLRFKLFPPYIYRFAPRKSAPSIAGLDSEAARSQAYNRRYRAFKQAAADKRKAEIEANRKVMARACYDAACKAYGSTSWYAESAKESLDKLS